MTLLESDNARLIRRSRCSACDAPLTPEQRYCVECGVCRVPLPARIAEMLDALADGDRAPGAAAPLEAPTEPETAFGLPAPRTVSVALLAMLAFGAVVGTITRPHGVAALADSVFLDVPAPARPTTVAAAPAPRPARSAGVDSRSSPSPPAPGSAAAQPAAAAPASGGGGAGGSSGGSNSSAGAINRSGGGSGSQSGASGGGSSTGILGLPAIRHVFLIMLSDQGYTQAFATVKGHRYLAMTLRRQGELIHDYYAVAASPLANEIALVSGQGPTVQTASDCPVFTPIPAARLGAGGQVIGDGCAYPVRTLTLANELSASGRTWRAYVQGMQDGPTGQPTACRRPHFGATDAEQTARPGDPYVTWRNPFVYFRSLKAGRGCVRNDLPLTRLPTDLRSVTSTPAFSYIAADPCDDGSDQPCTPGAPAGLKAADAFLRTVVPAIERSAAYKQDGLIAITFDRAPQSGALADNGSCCNQPAFPNLRGLPVDGPTTTTPGAGTTTTGTTPTTTSTTTPTVPTPTTSGTTTTVTTPTTATTATTPAPPCPTPTTPSTTTTSTTTPTVTTGAVGQCTTSGGTLSGGGQVGLLLISRYVKPGSTDAVDTFNHFSLLKTIERLFSLKPLGYATDPSLPVFDRSIFNAGG